MIDFYNQIICVILIILITVLFLKLLNTHKTMSTNIETFQDPTLPEKIYFGRIGGTSTTDRVAADGDYDDILDRLAIDKDFIKALNTYHREARFKKKLTIQVDNSEVADLGTQLEEDITQIPKKFAGIVKDFNNLNTQYANKKKQLEYIMINKLNNVEDVNDFNVKNLKLKKRLKDFTDSLRKYNVNVGIDPKCGRFMKNVATNSEINLQENTQLDGISNFRSGTNLMEEEVKVYFLNVNTLCVTNKSKTKIAIEYCSSNNLKQMFIMNEIKNNENYNKFIKLSGRYRPEHLIDILDTTITYPFFILSPYNTPGYAVLISNKEELSIRPIRNDPYQQFEEIFTSSRCDTSNKCSTS